MVRSVAKRAPDWSGGATALADVISVAYFAATHHTAALRGGGRLRGHSMQG